MIEIIEVQSFSYHWNINHKDAHTLWFQFKNFQGYKDKYDSSRNKNMSTSTLSLGQISAHSRVSTASNRISRGTVRREKKMQKKIKACDPTNPIGKSSRLGSRREAENFYVNELSRWIKTFQHLLIKIWTNVDSSCPISVYVNWLSFACILMLAPMPLQGGPG